MNTAKASFTAADSFPVKLLQNVTVVRNIVEQKIVPPAHVQIIPTNKCNLSCSFCSCAEEDRSLEMTRSEAQLVVATLASELTYGVTITGGGEPLLYPHLGYLLELLHFEGIKSGMVTNGLLLPKAETRYLKYLTWCRISQGDDREEWSEEFQQRLAVAIKSTPNVDWALSYVVSPEPNVDKILQLVNFASALGFTHVRLVSDLLKPDQVPMGWLKMELSPLLDRMPVPVIFQSRQEPEKGKDCYICYLKPVITPDMKVYACCGAQYALAKPSKKFPEELCLGSVDDLHQIIKQDSHKPFSGAKHCVTCYYGNYNRIIKALMSDTKHQEFI